MSSLKRARHTPLCGACNKEPATLFCKCGSACSQEWGSLGLCSSDCPKRGLSAITVDGKFFCASAVNRFAARCHQFRDPLRTIPCAECGNLHHISELKPCKVGGARPCFRLLCTSIRKSVPLPGQTQVLKDCICHLCEPTRKQTNALDVLQTYMDSVVAAGDVLNQLSALQQIYDAANI